MGKRNWKRYNRALIKRGGLSFYIDRKMIEEFKFPKRKKKIGRPYIYADELIKLILMIKIQYRLSYRALQGFIESTFRKLFKGLPLPSYSAICRRAPLLEPCLPRLSRRRPHTIILDASGLRICGEGEWKRKNGSSSI